MGSRTFYVWGVVSALVGGAVGGAESGAPGLRRSCPELLVGGGDGAFTQAGEVERVLRLTLAWTDEAPLFVTELRSPDGLPTYRVASRGGLTAILRTTPPGLAPERLTQELALARFGADLGLSPRPVDTGIDGVLVLREASGEPLEERKPAPIAEISEALRTLHGASPPATLTLPDGSLSAEVIAAVERHQGDLGEVAGELRAALAPLERARSLEARVPCLRQFSSGSARIDRQGRVRFAYWGSVAWGDRAEDYARVAEALRWDAATLQRFLTLALGREASAAEKARVELYRELLSTVPDPVHVSVDDLRRLARRLKSAPVQERFEALGR